MFVIANLNTEWWLAININDIHIYVKNISDLSKLQKKHVWRTMGSSLTEHENISKYNGRAIIINYFV